MNKLLWTMILLSIAISTGVALENEHEELGTIRWLRDYDEALRQAEEQGKPVLILFQEVPGCATCRNYGLHVLSHPLLAEAVEQLFIPLAVFNNRGGRDAEVLQLFREPSWNNPVVRIIRPTGEELTRRLAGDYSPGGFSAAMIDALFAFGTPVPLYLDLAHMELSARPNEETALLSMFCFWEGEIKLGAIPGVMSTRAGFVGGSEAVELRFDTRVLSFEQLVRTAARLRCADKVHPLTPRQRSAAQAVLGTDRIGTPLRFQADENTKYYLSRTGYRYLPMTEAQKVRINIAVYRGTEPDQLLSPRQRQALRFIHDNPTYPWRNLINSADFRGDWERLWTIIDQQRPIEN